ncbi:hypothetical protein JKF63_04172 [Porcisia hertigi]|uniref:Uncharacterized protein n=1 Tax=Porcisia hertigi TaxID=2761500 RepID=A0A836IB65_9TRYP|nr:hypothetical protein JKF63_04172 [Porcisia hertigi]
MPSCPDCGLVFESLYNVQQHRRYGGCSASSLGAPVTPSAALVQQPMMYAAGYPAMPAANPMSYMGAIGAGVYGVGKGGSDMLGAPVYPAAPVLAPHTSSVERGIDQVLALQRKRQEADMAERERMMLDQQVNLVLPARQAQLQQSQQVLKDQLLQMKLQLFANQQQQQCEGNMDMAFLRNEIAAVRGAISSINGQSSLSSDSGGPKQQKQHRYQKKRSSSAHTGAHRRRRQQESESTSESDSDEDDSWDNLDDDIRSVERDHHHGATRGRQSSGRSPRRVSPSGTKRSVLNSIQADIRSLRERSTTRMEPVFPTASMLEPGLHSLKLAALEGFDLALPLDEVSVSIKTYYMSYANNEYVLEPSLEQKFTGSPPPLVRQGANTVLFTIPSHDFLVHTPREMIVFVLLIVYRTRLVCWATIFARAVGGVSEGIRNTAFDLAKALQSPGDKVRGASVSGYIEVDSRDVLQHAESVLRGNALGVGVRPRSPLSQGQSVPLPGLPPLQPPPPGLPLLPGMPGCEGPFLPPTVESRTIVLHPSQGPVAHFLLPPPLGMSILEWKEEIVKHMKKHKRTSDKVTASASGKATANGKDTNLRQAAPLSRLQPKVKDPRSSSKSSSSSRSSSSSSQPSSPSLIRSLSEYPLLHSNDRANLIEEETSLHSPAKRHSPPRSGRGNAHLFECNSEKAPATRVVVDAEPVREPKSPDAPPHQLHTPPPPSPPPPPPPPRARPTPAVASSSPIDSMVNGTAGMTLPPPVVPQTPVLPAALPPPSGAQKVPCDDQPLVESVHLRSFADPQGNLAVPPNYKMKPNNPPAVNLNKLDVTADPPVNPCVLFGLSKPTDAPPPSQRTPGHGERGNTVDIFLDGVTGIPLDAVCSRVLVYITDELDPKTGTSMNPLHHPRAFMRKPDLVAYQILTSSSIEPEIKAKMSSEVSNQTHAVVIVEYINSRQGMPIVFGHCCVPINKRFFAGNYLVRVKAGDPRRSQERDVDEMRPPDRISDEQKRAMEKYDQSQMEASIDAQALRNLLPAPPRKRSECMPLGYLIWRLDSPDRSSPFFEMPQQVPLSQQELQLLADRKNHADVTPRTKNLMSEKAAHDAFVGPGTLQSDSISYLAPFSEQRGGFVKVEGIRGVGDDAAMYVVVVYMAKAPKGRQVCYTMMPDWTSDVGAPMYKDPPFLFPGIKYDQLNTLTFMLLKLSKLENAATLPVVECIGWTMNKLFMDEAPALRQGRYTLPWMRGPLPRALVQELLTQPNASVFMNHMKAKTIAFLEPKATLTISQGDPACCVLLVDDTPGRAQPRQLLMPSTNKKAFPSYTSEGMVGCTLRRAHEKCFGGGDPRALLQRINKAVQDYLSTSMKAFE